MTGITHETGMTPEQLEDKIKALRASHENLRQSWDESLTEAESQRDELLAALKALHACHRAFSSSENWTLLDDEARLEAEKAIAKIEGSN